MLTEARNELRGCAGAPTSMASGGARSESGKTQLQGSSGLLDSVDRCGMTLRRCYGARRTGDGPTSRNQGGAMTHRRRWFEPIPAMQGPGPGKGCARSLLGLRRGYRAAWPGLWCDGAAWLRRRRGAARGGAARWWCCGAEVAAVGWEEVRGAAAVPIKGIPGSWACVPGKIAAEIMAYSLAEDADRVQPPHVIRVRAGASRRRTWRAERLTSGPVRPGGPRRRSPAGNSARWSSGRGATRGRRRKLVCGAGVSVGETGEECGSRA